MNKDELKKKLTEEEYRVTQEKGTEQPFTNEYWDHHDEGMYECKVCGNPLFASDAKFDTHLPGLEGWPSFDQAFPGSVEYGEDTSNGMIRTEVVCSKCKSHLGHLFDDHEAKTGKHFCANSCALKFKKKDDTIGDINNL